MQKPVKRSMTLKKGKSYSLKIYVVEAAGIEPASANPLSSDTTCLAQSFISLADLRWAGSQIASSINLTIVPRANSDCEFV